MKVNKIVVGELQCNCYIIDNNKETIIIDPGAEYQKILNNIKNKKIVGIIITHKHFDHIGCLNNFINDYNYPIYTKNNLNIGQNKIGEFTFEVIDTKGHTDDSISIYFKKEKIMFTGDFLFEGSIGRTDLGGNMKDMKESIELIKTYPNDITIYPGHGNSTILGKEKEYNPFF